MDVFLIRGGAVRFLIQDTAFKQVPVITQGLILQLVGPLLGGSTGILDRWVFASREDLAAFAKLDREHPD